jgi:phenylacetate-CoA ligase
MTDALPFTGQVLDDVPALLTQSYRLRYEVYCQDRHFLAAERYPDGLETDAFDRHSVHVGVVNSQGEVVATARLIEWSDAGLPIFDHCTLFPGERPLQDPSRRVVEVSRLAISRDYNRRAGDDFYGLQGSTTHPRGTDRRAGGAIVLALYRALYQASKRRGFTHWVVATERSLQRLVAKYGFPFRLIGPETDYYGLVAPYIMDLRDFDAVILRGGNALLGEFLEGLEPEFRPAEVRGCQTEPSAGANEDQLLRAFRRVAIEMPWYRTLLDEQGVHPDEVVDTASFSRRCPVLTSANTFGRFPFDQLAATTSITGLAGVLTSSGHGGRFSFGLHARTRRTTAPDGHAIDRALDAAFQIETRSTLAINCLPMGVGFSSERMTVATTSVREDMAVALVQAFGGYYDQILLVADPLFLKRLLDYAASQRVDWRRYRVQVILGEEIFGEHFRDYVAGCLGQDVDRPEQGTILSSFGVGELGLHLAFETPATIAVRRAAASDPEFARDLLGVEHVHRAPPMLLTFDPQRTFIENTNPDPAGYGRLTISMLDADSPIPLLRYQTGDRVRVLDRDVVTTTLRARGLAAPQGLPACMLALEGRERERLPNGSHVRIYKDALYADPRVADAVTGAFRTIFSGAACTMHVQLAPTAVPATDLARRLIDAIPAPFRPARLVCWPYSRFPFGMTVDYERKFSYYVAGEPDVRPDVPTAETTSRPA